jgi:PAS domain S-box-containing protein
MTQKPTYKELEQRVEALERVNASLSKEKERAVNITKRKYADEEQNKPQDLLSKALEVANIAPWEYDVANDLFMFNDHFYRLLRTTAEEEGGYTMSSEEYVRRFVHPDDIHVVEESIKRSIDVIDPDSEQRVEYRVICGDGSVGYTSVKLLVVKDSQGKTVRTFGVNQDITERKQAEIEREKLQTQLSNAVEIANLAPWEYDIANDLFTFNDHFYKVFRTTAEEQGGYTMSSGEHARRFIHPDDIDDLESVEEAVEAIDPDSGSIMEHRVVFDDGSVGYVSVKSAVVKDSQGNPILTYGVNQDITEQKQAETEREKLQVLLSNAVEISKLAPWEFDVAKDVFIFNDHFYKLFRTTAEDVGGYEMSPEEFARRFVHPDEIHLFRETMKEDKAPGQNIKRQLERRIIYCDGSVGYTSVNLLFIKDGQGNTIRIYGATQDITERKQAEIEREKLQAQLSNALEIANLAPWEYDIVEDLFTLNDHFYKIFHTTAEEVGGYTMSSEEHARRFVHPDDVHTLESINESIQKIDPESGERLEHRIIYGDGTVGYMSVKAFVVKDGQGKAIRTYGVNQDITERKQAEIDREKLQAQLSNALEIANLAPWEYDVAEDLYTLNDHFYKVFRTTAEEVGGYTMSSEEFARRFVHPDELRTFEERINESKKGTDPDYRQRLEHRIIYGDGTPGYMSVIPFMVKDSQGKTVHTYGATQDITGQKRMEEELLRARKLESIGILAGGIAHDFNNILTTILGNIALAKMDVGPKDEIFPLLSDVETASSRAQALTKQLLTFAKGGAPIKETSSIKEVITESSIFVLRGSKSSCEFSIAEDLWPVEVDVGQISQVINNIVMNANQAMPNGGRIQVTGENLTIEDKHGLPIKPGRYVRISIRDQGLGIAKEDIVKVFDPYFTTKPEGSGLGLATTYSIVKNHDGHITVESELGKGTTFQIYLPASEKTVQETAEDRVIPGTGKILIMDDEVFVRKTLGKILEKLGYEPEFASEGAEAIEMYKTAEESGKPYEAVILDLTIPGGMGGKDTMKKLLEIKSGAKAIVSSGYSDDSLLANFQEYGFRGILPKPFDPQAVSKVLNEVIQGKAGP